MAHRDTLIEASKLSPTSLLELYILDARNIGVINNEVGSGGVFRFHSGTNGLYNNIIFNTDIYYSFPVESSGFEYDGKGSLPRPVLKCANIKGYMSAFLREGKHLVGAKVYRRRVFARFIDNENFVNEVNPFGTPNTDGAYPDDIFYVNRKINENKFFVEFELATQLEIDNVTLPRRKCIATSCVWNYRGEGCEYAGAPIADASNQGFTTYYGLTLTDLGEWASGTAYTPGNYVYISSTLDGNFGELFYFVCKTAAQGVNDYPTSSSKWIADTCSKNIAGCRLRFGTSAELPAGLFPGLSRLKFS